jgi:transposase
MDDRLEEVRSVLIETGNVVVTSQRTGIPKTTIRAWCPDLIALNRQKADARTAEIDQGIVEMRLEVAKSQAVDIKKYMAKLQLSDVTLRKALRGITHTHLNSKAAPVCLDIKKDSERLEVRRLYTEKKIGCRLIKKTMAKAGRPVSSASVSRWLSDLIQVRNQEREESNKKLRQQARTLYAAGGVTTHDISKKMKISNERVAAWCADLIDARHGERKKRTAAKQAARPGRPQLLTDEQVLEIRRRVRASGIKDWVKLAKEYRVAPSSVAYAAKGITFRRLNDQVAPITDADARSAPKGRAPTKTKRKWKSDLPDELIDEIIELRRSDPVKWTYGECGRLLFERTGKKYCAGPVSVLILRRRPEMKELEKIYVPRKPRDPETRKKYKPLTESEKKEKAARMRAWRLAKMTQREQDADLQRLFDAEDAYEAGRMKKAA